MKFENLPKIELHCHLDGSVRPETIIDIAKKEGISIPYYDIENIKKEVTAPSECKSLDEYLKRFEIPNLVMQSKESLRRITFELLEDSAKENVKYIEVRFAPLLHVTKGLNLCEVIESVISGIKDAEDEYDIKGNVILSCMRFMSIDRAFEVVEAGRKYISKGVVAIDLCGSEGEGFCEKFIEPIKLAREYGYRVTIHAGETGIGKNVMEAVELLGAERIGHGVFIKDCIEAYNIVKDKGITLEMCPTSNIQTKAVDSFKDHPFYDFYNDGVKVTVNTDNRTVSDTNMTVECNVLLREFNITFEEYKKIYLNSVDAAFTDLETKEWLRKYI
ncbi:adenosine deaminase [Clostridium tagluense]|uniref:adenosine deaminase n=1 Tax=Clostridium tagluense TaxID=360422 RepID=UPI001C0D10E9|nr:adenosine deaminase [Clostridium tagluense]MBU3128841.1 adenosine deaminase [Clostridium tagluense]MCB2313090.1 adenosine deaminase [Clostridium tagluense]MCB2317801.1 adenosine deaminase [Clostridium tagluense]MCB2322585.1 adenosine deaminase [Clostridium tagluense]MCB2327639.1 adenosine deaminase [Clostridium tagluense]